MRYSIVAAAILCSAVVAQPQRVNKRHVHNHHQKRDIVWVTDVEIVTETVDVTTTVWVAASSTQAPMSTSTQAPVVVQSSTSPIATTLQSVFTAQQASSTPNYVAPVPSTSVYIAPVAPTTSSTPVSVAPVVPTTSSTPVAAVVTPTPTPAVFVEPTSSTTSAKTTVAAAATSAAAGTSSYSGTCAKGSPCSGDITYYDTGLGACGWTNDGTTENVVALPHGLMGTQSNGNPYCGMTITVSKGGKTITAKVVDKCMGCVGNAIDLSTAAFDSLASASVGRTTADWWFN